MISDSATTEDSVDDGAVAQIVACVTSQPRQSFFLFAGAGSGKTRSLIVALNAFREVRAKDFRNAGQQGLRHLAYVHPDSIHVIGRTQFPEVDDHIMN